MLWCIVAAFSDPFVGEECTNRAVEYILTPFASMKEALGKNKCGAKDQSTTGPS